MTELLRSLYSSWLVYFLICRFLRCIPLFITLVSSLQTSLLDRVTRLYDGSELYVCISFLFFYRFLLYILFIVKLWTCVWNKPGLIAWFNWLTTGWPEWLASTVQSVEQFVPGPVRLGCCRRGSLREVFSVDPHWKTFSLASSSAYVPTRPRLLITHRPITQSTTDTLHSPKPKTFSKILKNVKNVKNVTKIKKTQFLNVE